MFIRAAGDHERVELTRDFLDAQHPFRVRDEALHLGDSLLGFPIGAADGVRGEVAAHAVDPQVRAADDAHARRGLVLQRRPTQMEALPSDGDHDSTGPSALPVYTTPARGPEISALRRVGKLGDVRDVEVVVVRLGAIAGIHARRCGGEDAPGDGSAGAERCGEAEDRVPILLNVDQRFSPRETAHDQAGVFRFPKTLARGNAARGLRRARPVRHVQEPDRRQALDRAEAARTITRTSAGRPTTSPRPCPPTCGTKIDLSPIGSRVDESERASLAKKSDYYYAHCFDAAATESSRAPMPPDGGTPSAVSRRAGHVSAPAPEPLREYHFEDADRSDYVTVTFPLRRCRRHAREGRRRQRCQAPRPTPSSSPRPVGSAARIRTRGATGVRDVCKRNSRSFEVEVIWPRRRGSTTPDNPYELEPVGRHLRFRCERTFDEFIAERCDWKVLKNAIKVRLCKKLRRAE